MTANWSGCLKSAHFPVVWSDKGISTFAAAAEAVENILMYFSVSTYYTLVIASWQLKVFLNEWFWVVFVSLSFSSV